MSGYQMFLVAMCLMKVGACIAAFREGNLQMVALWALYGLADLTLAFVPNGVA